MGMFDSVIGRCPHCNEKVELQSKAGDCLMNVYGIDSIPPEIANDLRGNYKEWNTTCEHCGERYKFKSEVPARVQGRLVPYTEEDDEEEYD
jgi:hypothetical protein